MYRDARLIKDKVIKLRVDDYINKRFDALAELTGQQKSVLIREYAIRGLEHHESKFKEDPAKVEGDK